MMNRHVKRHLEMERLFGADFVPRTREASPEPTGAYSREFLDFMKPVLECTKCGLHETISRGVVRARHTRAASARIVVDMAIVITARALYPTHR